MSHNETKKKQKSRIIITLLPAIFMVTLAVVIATTILPMATELRESSQQLYHKTIDSVITSSDNCPIVEEQMSKWKNDIDNFWHFNKETPQQNYDKLKEKHDLYCK